MRWLRDRILPIVLVLTVLAGVVWAAGEIHYDRNVRFNDNITLYFGTDEVFGPAGDEALAKSAAGDALDDL